MATYLGSKYQEHDMNSKIINGGAATLKGLAIAGKFLYKITKPVVKYASIRAVQGVGYLCKQAEFQLSDDENDYDDDEEDEKDKSKKNKKEKKKKIKKQKKEKNSFNLLDSNNSNISDSNITNNNQGNDFYLSEGQYIFEPCVDYPSFESINKIENINYNQNNNNNININPYNGNNNIDINLYNENNKINVNQQTPCINNHIVQPNYVIPPGLDSSSLESSIVGEK